MFTRFFYLLCLLAIVFITSGCTFMIKTPIVADYSKLSTIDKLSSKSDIERIIGKPQGDGVHIINGKQYDLKFYHGMYGKFTLSTALMNSGLAFISYSSNEMKNVIQMSRKISDGELLLKRPIPVKSLTNKIVIGQSKIDPIIELLGQPMNTGKRVDKENGISHDLAYWDATKFQDNKEILEKWLLIGYDTERKIQDIIWVSSDPEDIKGYGEIAEQTFKQINPSGIFKYNGSPTIESSNNIDSFYVDSLLNNRIDNVKKFIDTFGLPTAVGIKSFKNEPPLNLSNWSYSKMKISGRVEGYIPPNASGEDYKNDMVGKTYFNMDVKQTRLMVGHDSSGNIKEVFWAKPFE